MEIITRPITMLITEPIIQSTAIYISLAYSLVFFYFQAYPIIFRGMLTIKCFDWNANNKVAGVYGFDVEKTSLTYIPSRSK